MVSSISGGSESERLRGSIVVFMSILTLVLVVLGPSLESSIPYPGTIKLNVLSIVNVVFWPLEDLSPPPLRLLSDIGEHYSDLPPLPLELGLSLLSSVAFFFFLASFIRFLLGDLSLFLALVDLCASRPGQSSSFKS